MEEIIDTGGVSYIHIVCVHSWWANYAVHSGGKKKLTAVHAVYI